MFTNYLKVAWRNLVRSKWAGAINIFGLAIGITASLLLFVIIQYEMSFDKFQSHYNEIYRIVSKDKYPDGFDYNPGVNNPVPDAIAADNLPFEEVVPVKSAYNTQVNIYKDAAKAGIPDKYEIDYTFYTTPDFADLFDLEFASGDIQSLSEPNKIILTKTTAAKFFGSWELAENKTLDFSSGLNLTVGGIVEDIPDNSNMFFDMLVSYQTIRSNPEIYDHDLESWGSLGSDNQLYVSLAENADLASAQSALDGFTKKNFEGRGNSEKALILQPYKDIHFDQVYGSISGSVTRLTTVNTLAIIGLFILVMASINFVNLATSRAIGKGKEIGVRKVMGSTKTQIIFQSFGETFLSVLIAALIGMLAATFLLPFLSLIADVPEKMDFFQPIILAFVGILVLTLTLLSGFYPALVISKFKPIHALKSKFQQNHVGGISVRKALVVVQFAIAQILMISTIIAIQQMNMVQDADLGFTKEHVYFVEVPFDTEDERRIEYFKQELQGNPSVVTASLASDVPASDNNSLFNFYFDGKKEDVPFPAYAKFGDEKYFETYDIEFVAGGPYQQSDTIKEVVINETMVKRLLIEDPNDAIGKQFRLGMMREWATVTGVIKDFTVNSLRDEIKQLVIAPKKEFYRVVGLKLDQNASLENVAKVEEAFDKVYPEQIYHGYFLDESIQKFYESEQKLALVFKIFAGISILISCIGLYGLVSFMISQKVKEIGIRKVLGASVSQITFMLSREYFLMVLLAFFIAVPIAYWMMERWLENFAFKIPFSTGLFVIVMICSLLITGLTVGSKAIKSALANPVDSLSDE
ncbi:ABC transporter permease [Algoriphagus pacificus]|uniref:ABC transporter permease n=1 Tax=Algoriphagus pacificus TaxID=2811234 RepID=A0ABS3CJV8_9BACT|nr:ABC transporter permease [Algoriphagus pacificus]MBN7817337.1 ABC transporter permease [Algoriphagus pacificus]